VRPTTKKLVWFKNLYSIFIFSVFLFIENEYNDNFVNIVKV